MSKWNLNAKDISPLLRGLTLYGTGGGGEEAWGRVILENEFRQNRICEVVSPDEVPDDSFVCCGGIMGSVKSLEAISYEDITLQWEKSFPLCDAIREMENIKGRKVDYLIPFEVGALNTPVIMSATARLGIPVIDGDGNGRSAPETQMTSFTGHGINLYPMPLVDADGNVNIVLKGNSLTYADEVGRFIVVKGGGLGANSHYPMTGAQVKSACVPNTISDALELGKKIENAHDPIESFCQHFGGRELFRGTIDSMIAEDKGGFYLMNVALKGTGKFQNKKAKLVVKNETMAFWVEEKLAIVFPDRAFMLNPNTGEGIPSVAHKVGLNMVIVGAPCHTRIMESMNSSAGKIAFSGERFGYPELKYVPFSEL